MSSSPLVGNALCLDFTNTVNNRHLVTRDHLATAESTATWARLVGVRIDRAPSSADLRAARIVRETLHRVFGQVARGTAAGPADLLRIRDWFADAISRATFGPSGDEATLTMEWPPAGDLSVLVDRVVASAVELLTRGPLDRVGACPRCGWLFVDTSKNGRRRWCSMAVCGNREKVRRHSGPAS